MTAPALIEYKRLAAHGATLADYSNGRHTYVKCERHRLGPSHSAASDVRVSWPACTEWEPGS